MGFMAAVGAFGTVKSFAQEITNVFEAESPLDYVKTLIGYDDGPSIQDLHMQTMDAIGSMMDFHVRQRLDDAKNVSNQALQMVLAHHEAPNEQLRSFAIMESQKALMHSITTARHICETGSPEDVVAAISAVTMAVNARIAVVNALQDGAFARASIAKELKSATDFLEAAPQHLIDSLGLNVEVKYGLFEDGWGVFSTIFPGLLTGGATIAASQWDWNFYITSDEINVTDYASAYQILDDTTAWEHNHRGDNLVIAPDHVSKGLWGPEQERADFANLLMERVSKAVLKDAGLGPNGEVLYELADTVKGMLDGEQILGSQEGEALDYTDGTDGVDGADFFNGYAGDDTIEGGAGNDVIRGGRGKDVIDGGEGSDVIYAGMYDPENPFGSPDAFDGFSDQIYFRDYSEVDTIKGLDLKSEKVDEDGNAVGDHLVLDRDGFEDLDWSVTENDVANGWSEFNAKNKAFDENTSEERVNLVKDGDSLYYAPDSANGKADAFKFANVVNFDAISAEDFKMVDGFEDLLG